MGQKQLFRSTETSHDLISFILCLCISILFFHWHLQASEAGCYILHIALFYPVNIGFLFGILYGCKFLNQYKSTVITNLSMGTLVIIGLHIILVTVTNFIISHSLFLMNHFSFTSDSLCYHWYTAFPIALVICALFYPIILLTKRHAPILLGKKTL